MLTLSDTLNTPGIKRVVGSCTNNQNATDLVNEAARRLLRRGDWIDTLTEEPGEEGE